MKKQFGVGIIGTGRVGVDWHLPDIRTAGGSVMALADAVPGRAGKYAAVHDVPHGFDDYRDLIDDPEVDIVSICTPPVSHEEIATYALKAGKPVYLEKPPAMNATEMERIVNAARRTGTLLFSGSNMIYFPPVQSLKRKLDRGELGEIYHVECLKIIRRSFKRGWHRRKEIGGGGAGMDSAPHRLDAVLYLLDCPTVRSVSARTFDHFVQRPLPPPEESGYLLMDVAEGVGDQEPPANVEDSLVAFIQYENGMTMVLRDFQSANMRNESKIRLYGTKQGAEFPHTLAAHEDPLLLFGEDEDGVTYDQRPQVASRHGGSHVAAYRHLFNCIREGKETLSPGERSVQVMRIVDAVYRSASEGGREIKISR